MDKLFVIMGSLDWSPLFITLKTAVVVTVLCFFLGIFAAARMMHMKKGVRAVLDGIFTLPMVLPPTVAGFFLLLVFSLRRPLGAYLYGEFDIKLVQTWAGCVLAAFIIAFPLMYTNARAAFEQVDTDLIDAGKTLGMSDRTIFLRVVIPAAGPGLASGAVLSFARSIGEYGATSMFAGNIAGRTGTIAQQIAYVIKDGDYLKAGIWTAIVVAIAFFVILLLNLLSNRKNDKRWK
ncbi:MAG: molybdate ABC transporter permease subunit [Eubacterium sp.]|nr:molybdate ABC transporter permease subunit [Eubacterium sp.]